MFLKVFHYGDVVSCALLQNWRNIIFWNIPIWDNIAAEFMTEAINSIQLTVMNLCNRNASLSFVIDFGPVQYTC